MIDATTFDRISSNLVLTGTTRNCAGGVSPWGWLSCEETFNATHGYVFVCPTDASTVRARKRPVNRTFPPPPGSRTMDAIVAAPGGDTWRRRECVKFP